MIDYYDFAYSFMIAESVRFKAEDVINIETIDETGSSVYRVWFRVDLGEEE